MIPPKRINLSKNYKSSGSNSLVTTPKYAPSVYKENNEESLDKYQAEESIDNDETISPKEKLKLKDDIVKGKEQQVQSNSLGTSIATGIKNTNPFLAPVLDIMGVGKDVNTSYKELADNAKIALRESKDIKFLQNNPDYILKNYKTGMSITAKDFLANTKKDKFIESVFGLNDSPIEGRKLTIDKSAFFKSAGLNTKNISDLSEDQQMLYSYKNKDSGKDELGLVTFKDIKEVEEIGGKVISAYGPKQFSKGVAESLWEGLGKTLVTTPKMALNAASSVTTIASALANYITPGSGNKNSGKFKADSGMFNKLSDELDNYAKIYKNESTYNADENMFGVEALSGGLGAGVGSLLQFGAMGRVARGLALGGEALASASMGVKAGSVIGTNGALGGVKAMDYIINMGAGGVLNHGEAYDAAKEAGMSVENRALFATSVGLLNAAVETGVGANRVMNYLSGGESKTLNRTLLKSLEDYIGKPLSKVTNRELTNGIDKTGTSMFNTIMDGITRFTEREVVGTMAEEAGEEAIQTLVSKASESLYDAYIAPHTENKKEFGTEFFSKDTFLEMTQAALIGGLVGGISGLTMQGVKKIQNKKDNTVLQNIVEGDIDKVQAMVSKLYDSGYITETERDNTRDRIGQLDKIYSKNSDLFKHLEGKTPKESAELKAAAFGLVNLLNDHKEDIDKTNSKIQEVINDKELLPELKKVRLEALRNELKAKEFTKDFLSKEVERYVTPVNGKIDAIENPDINSTINERHNQALIDYNVSIYKDIISSVQTSIDSLVQANENLETTSPEYKSNLNEISSLEEYKKSYENKISELNNPVVPTAPEVSTEETTQPPVTTPVLNTTPGVNTSQEPLNAPVNNNNNSDIDDILEQIEENEKLLEDPNIDDENKANIQENINSLNEQLQSLHNTAQDEIISDQDFLNNAVKDIEDIDKDTSKSILDKKESYEIIKDALEAKIKANQKLGIKDNSEFQFAIDYINSNLQDINNKIEKAENEAKALKKAEELAKANNPKPADAVTDVFSTESFFTTIYRTPGLLNNPETMTTEELVDLLINTPIEELQAGLSFRFSNEFVTPGTVRSKTKNSIVKFVDPVWNIQVIYNGKIIGLLPESTKIMIGDTIVDWNTITKKEFNDYLSKTADFERTVKLLNDLQKLEALNEVIDLNIEDLKSLGIKINVTNGGFQVLPVAQRLTVRELENAKLDALSGGYYVYDRTNSTFITDSSVNMINQEGVPAIPDNLQERYVVLTQTGDGTYRWVSAQQPELSNDQIKLLQAQIADAILQIEANPEDTELLSKLNKMINDKVFITGTEYQDSEFILTKPQSGKSKLLIKTNLKGKGVKATTVELNPKKIGTSIKGEKVLDRSNLRTPLAKNITNEAEVLDGLKVNIGQDIVANPQLNITFDTDALNDFQAGIVIADNEEVNSISPEVADIERRRQEELIANIYTQLGDKTVSGNVTLKSVYQQAGIDFAKSIGGIFSLRVTNSNKHFGNPFSNVPSEIAKGLIATKSTKESVEKYIDWVLFSNEERAKWIREQLKSGNLKNKPIIYYKELGEPSHATALDYLINAKYNAELKALEENSNTSTVSSIESFKEFTNLTAEQKEAIAKNLPANVKELDLSKRVNKTIFKQAVINEITNNQPDIVFSIQDGNMVIEQATDFEAVQSYLDRVLPSDVQLKDISDMMKKVANKGMTYGAFQDNVIYLAKNAPKGTEYHEAFHKIFRTLLSDNQIDKILNYTKNKYGAPTKQELDNLRNSSPLYTYLTSKELENLYYEEKLADNYRDFTLGRNYDTRWGRIWEKMKSIVNFITGNSNELEALYSNINRGKFKNSNAIRNRYTAEKYPVFSIYNKGLDNNNNVIKATFKESANVAATTAALVQKAMSDKDNPLTFDKALDKIIKQQKALYDISKSVFLQEYSENLNDAQYERFEAKLLDKSLIFSNEDNIEMIKEDVKEHFKIFAYQDEEAENIKEVSADDIGERFGIDPWTIGGISSLSQAVRGYIGFTTYMFTDEFGQSIERAVDAFTVYKGLTRSLAGLSENDMLQRFKLYADYNPEAKAVFNKLVNDTGINIEDLSTIPNNDLLRKFINSFKNESVDWLTVLTDSPNSSTSVIESNRKSAKNTQVDEWANNFFEKSIKLNNDKVQKELNSVVGDIKALINIKEYVSDVELNKKANEISRELNKFGINVSNGYIVYSIVKHQIETLKVDVKGELLKLYNSYNNSNGLFDKGLENLVQISNQIKAGNNPYEIKFANGIETGAKTRLENIAEQNTVFDETVLDSTFQNADGKNIYSIIKSSYGLSRLREIRTESRNKYKQDNFISPEGRILNHLLNDKLTDVIFNNMKVAMFDGIREGSDSTAEGTVFGKFNGRDYLLSDISLFVGNRKNIYDGNNIVKTNALFNINQMEASNTGYLISLPVETYYDKNGISKKAYANLYGYLKQEYLRIVQANIDFDNKDITRYKGYNDTKKGRAFKLTEFSSLSNAAAINELANKQYANQEEALKALETIETDILTSIKANLEEGIQSLLDTYTEYGIKESSLPVNSIKSLKKEGYINDTGKLDMKAFVSDMYINQYLNTLGVNNLLFGDYTKGIKNTVDWFKRAKGILASGNDLGAGETKIAVFKEPVSYVNDTMENTSKEKSTKSIDRADAQSYVTLDHKILQVSRWGKYDNKVEAIYDKIKEGKDITWEEAKLLEKNGAALNSTKTVIYDGIHYIKTSEFILTPRLVGEVDDKGDVIMNDNGFPKTPKKGMEFLYNLYKSMVEQGVDQAMPETASKMATKNVAELNNEGNFNFTESVSSIDNVHKRLQVETPSGKTKVIHGTQLLQLITSEQQDDLKVDFPSNKDITNLGQLRQHYRQLLADNRYESFRQTVSALENGETSDINLDVLAQKFYETVQESGATEVQLKFFEVGEDGKKKFNWNLSPIISKSEELFLAHFSKGILSQKVAGLKVSLVSDLGFKNPQGKDLAFMQKDADGNYYSECLLPAFTQELLGKNPTDARIADVLKMFGIRIPTQDKSFMTTLKVVGFLPVEYGSVGVFPKQIVLLSGADFDIDSMFIHRYDFYKKGDKLVPYGKATTNEGKYKEWKTYQLANNKELQKVISKLTDAPFEESIDNLYDFIELIATGKKEIVDEAFKTLRLPTTLEEYIAQSPINIGANNNAMLDAQMLMLTNDFVRTGAALTETSLDSLKDIIKEFKELSGETIAEYSPNTPIERFKANRSNSEGSEGIGIVALGNNTANFLTSYDVNINSEAATITIDGTVVKGFNSYLNTEDNRKNSDLSTLLSGMTDNAKEQIAFYLNLSEDLLPVATYLLSIGVPLRTAMLLVNQPILKYATKIKKSNGTFQTFADSFLSDYKKTLPKGAKIDIDNNLQVDNSKLEKALGQNIYDIEGEALLDQVKVAFFIEDIIKQSGFTQSVSSLLALNKGVNSSFDDNSRFDRAIESTQIYKLLPPNNVYKYNEAIEYLISNEYIQEVDGKYIEGPNYPNFRYNKDINKSPYDPKLALINDANAFNNILIYKKLMDNLSKQVFASRLDVVRNLNNYTGSKNKEISNYLVNRNYENYISKEEDLTQYESYKEALANYGNLLKNTPNNIEEQLTKLKSDPILLKNSKLLRMLKVDPSDAESKTVNLVFPTRIKDPNLFNELSNDYNRLYSDPETKDFAVALYYYTYFKTGLQFKNNSPINIVGNYMFDKMSKSLDNFMSSQISNNDIRESLDSYYSDITLSVNPIIDLPKSFYKIAEDKKSITISPITEKENPASIYNKEKTTELTEKLLNFGNLFNELRDAKNVFKFPYSYKTLRGTRLELVSYKAFENNTVNEYPIDGIINNIKNGIPVAGFEAVYKAAKVQLSGDPDITGEGFDVNFKKDIYNNSTISLLDTSSTKSLYESIVFQEEPTSGYRTRTVKNASADATIALATDFSSAGERLTKSSVLNQNKKYIPIDANTLEVTEARINKIVDTINSIPNKQGNLFGGTTNGFSLNIAGNGIYTMKGKYTQEQVDEFTYQLLKSVLQSPRLNKEITLLRSGGQTGFDEAGIKAGVRLGIPTLALAPKGWTFRDVTGRDINSEEQFKARFANVQVSEQELNRQAEELMKRCQG